MKYRHRVLGFLCLLAAITCLYVVNQLAVNFPFLPGAGEWTTGPAVFVRLGTLQRGDLVHVPRLDGKRSTFVVTRVARFDKERFPTADIFGPTVEPALRLVTCGGDFDFARHSYRANVVVFASLIGNN